MTLARPLLALAALAFVTTAAPAQVKPKAKPRPDLADIAQGHYAGSVISDARGSSRSDVSVTVTKTAPNTVRVEADYARIPARTYKLTRAMQTIQNAGGAPGEVFLLELAKSPPQLGLTIDDASWSGAKQP